MVKDAYMSALKNGYALGAFNFSSLEMLKSIIQASKQTGADVIAAVSEGALKYIGSDFLKAIIQVVKSDKENRVMFHLDHGKTFDICVKAIELGFDSVMIDASSLPFDENVALTKKVCDYAHSKNVFVEGEIGVLAGKEEDVEAEKTLYTDPVLAKEFAEKTGVDSLAIAIGTSHGAYKFKGDPKLCTKRLKEIQDLIPSVPLVLHGASSVYAKYTDKFNLYGGTLEGTKGVPDEILKDVCTNYHICKVNTDTDLRICFLANLKESLQKNSAEIDLRKHMNYANDEVTKLIVHKIEVFGFKHI